jgi:hypothetical protein
MLDVHRISSRSQIRRSYSRCHNHRLARIAGLRAPQHGRERFRPGLAGIQTDIRKYDAQDPRAACADPETLVGTNRERAICDFARRTQLPIFGSVQPLHRDEPDLMR